LELEPSKAILIELSVKQSVAVKAFYHFLQLMQMGNGDNSCLKTTLS
jgi:hypothetical protein